MDERQVNLTRFPLFFPEKREFFLEGRGIFGFAQGGVTGRFLRPTASLLGGFFGDVNVPQLFYSRKIGLEEGRVVPIVGGARVTGKIGPFDVGALNIQAGDEMVSRFDPTNFTVVRLRRDILRRSSVGAMFTNRSVSRVAPGSSQAYGVDGTFALFENVNVITYLARTRVPGPDHRGKDGSYQGVVDYAADRYGLRVEHLVVEDNFLPEVGFLRRDNFRRSYVSGRFSPRPQSDGERPAVQPGREHRLHRHRRPEPPGDAAEPADVPDRSRWAATASPTRRLLMSSGSSDASTGRWRCGGAPTSAAT